jgi:hypothetical protein
LHPSPEGLGFLRILRTLRLLHTYQLVARLRDDSSFFRRNEEPIIAVVNLGVFLFIMTGVVYWRNPEIANYVDALYFTVGALTTTGFGDITLKGSLGRLIANRHNDLRRDTFPKAPAGIVTFTKSALPLSSLRARTARTRCSSLQGLWQTPRNSGRGSIARLFATSDYWP